MDKTTKPIQRPRKKRRGTLTLIGGAERRHGRGSILSRLVEDSRAKCVAIIPTASQYPRELGAAYRRAFTSLGVSRAQVLDIRNRKEAFERRCLEKMEESDLVFFTGGDQVRLVEILSGTPLLTLIREKHEAGMPLAGTSAGAAAASNPMIFDGDRRGLIKGSVGHGVGFGFLPEITVDTHFLPRQRITRLTQFLLRGLSYKGIGLDEDTALIVDHRGVSEVIGGGTVTVLNAKGLTYNNYHRLEPSQPVSANNLRLGFLSQGMRFSLSQWRVIHSAQTRILAS